MSVESLDPGQYDEFAKSYEEERVTMFRQIANENNQGMFDIVLDIGCGTGNTTLKLENEIKVNQIYGIDLDEEMIEFAKQNHMKDNIKYIAQDFGVEFEGMTSELRALEGKVSLIYSYACLQLITDKERVAKNLYHFAQKGGKVYTSMMFIYDIYKGLLSDNSLFMSVPKRDQELNEWMEAFKGVGFHVIRGGCNVLKRSWSFQYYVQNVLTRHSLHLRQYFIDTNEDKVDDKNDKLLTKMMSYFKQFTDERTGDSLVAMDLVELKFMLEK